jgi:hypothetical protein
MLAKAEGSMLTARRAFAVALLLLLPVPQASTQSTAAPITTPQQQFGASIGDDYFLATYTQLEAYWKKLDRESDRMQLVDIGRTEEGRTQWLSARQPLRYGDAAIPARRDRAGRACQP